MRTTTIRLLLICTILATMASCSLYDNHQASRPAKVMEVEARLVQAGFHRVPIETPAQNGAVAQLPLHRINRYQSASGSVFWYADPTVCGCLYEGDQQAYESYAGLLQQEHDTAEYVNDVEPEQVAYLSPFGYALPPPLLLTGWPTPSGGNGAVFIPHGSIHSVAGTGGGVTPRSGNGGVISRGGHGHGGIGHGGHR